MFYILGSRWSFIFMIELTFAGGYVAGRSSFVEAAIVHLSAPGVDGGATFNQYKNLFQVSYDCQS